MEAFTKGVFSHGEVTHSVRQLLFLYLLVSRNTENKIISVQKFVSLVKTVTALLLSSSFMKYRK